MKIQSPRKSFTTPPTNFSVRDFIEYRARVLVASESMAPCTEICATYSRCVAGIREIQSLVLHGESDSKEDRLKNVFCRHMINQGSRLYMCIRYKYTAQCQHMCILAAVSLAPLANYTHWSQFFLLPWACCHGGCGKLVVNAPWQRLRQTCDEIMQSS